MIRPLYLAALLAAATTSAGADTQRGPIPQKARDLAERGRALHDAGDYVNAIAAFREAYVLAPSPGLLFNLAQAYRLAGQCDDAAWMYRRFLDTNPTTSQRSLAETHLQAVEKCGHGGLRVAISPPVIEAAVPEPHLDTPVASAPLAVAASPADPAGEREQRIGIGLAIGGGVVLLGAAYFAVDAHEAADTVTAAYDKGGKWSDISAANQRGQRSATMAEAFGAVGGAAALSGAIVYAIGRHHERLQHLAIAPTRDGANVRLSWGF